MTTGESPHVPHWEYQLAMKKSGTGDSAVPFSSSGSSPFKVRSMSDIVPGKAEESLFYKVLKGPVKEDKDEIGGMPKPKRGEDFKPLPDEKVQLLKAWIDQGANWGK